MAFGRPGRAVLLVYVLVLAVSAVLALFATGVLRFVGVAGSALAVALIFLTNAWTSLLPRRRPPRA